MNPAETKIQMLNWLSHPSTLDIYEVFKIFLNVYFLRERQSVSGEGSEREGGRPEYEAGSGLRVVSTETNGGLEPVNREIMTWAKVGRLTNGATQASHNIYIPLK